VLAVPSEQRISQHREIVGHLLHARAIRLADLGHDFADLCGEGFRCGLASSLQQIDCRE
jgi:hypothetical protein